LKRLEAIRILRPFFDSILSLSGDLETRRDSLLRELALLAADAAEGETGPLRRRIRRRYARLCHVSGELSRLDFKKADSGVSPEDFIFSRIDFSKYREISEEDFETFFLGGFEDFDDTVFKKNFRAGRKGIQSLIEGSYKKKGGIYTLERANPLILSVMRTLDVCLEDLPLFTADEICDELKNIPGRSGGGRIPEAETLFPLLVSILDGVSIPHEDGMKTRLFISVRGDLSGTFRPGNKPWTRVLIKIPSN
jgi:hypothetical protein